MLKIKQRSIEIKKEDPDFRYRLQKALIFSRFHCVLIRLSKRFALGMNWQISILMKH